MLLQWCFTNILFTRVEDPARQVHSRPLKRLRIKVIKRLKEFGHRETYKDF